MNPVGKRTAIAVRAALTNPGADQDGDGLFLKVDKRQDMGLGSAKLPTLAEAREKASGL